MNTWPIPWADVFDQLNRTPAGIPSPEVAGAMTRLRDRARWELDTGEWYLTGWASAAAEPRVIRTFENTPREEAEAGLAFSWTGNRFTVNLSAAYANDPVDGEEFRPDDTYVGMVLGNWMVTAGWQQRWWGPGNDASSILSSNARPRPGVTLQRNLSTPFETKWLSWLGPWNLTTFMEHLDDERATEDPLLWGFRFGFRPLKGLEINVTRTAMWCGEGRPCDFSTFLDVLKGNDNQGQNTTPEDEPGNQMAGYDIRWSLPKDIPVALYMQWTAEDGRPQGVPLGSFLRMVGAEYWGTIWGLSHRTHLEVADTTAREGGFGFSDKKPNSAYNHPLYRHGLPLQQTSHGAFDRRRWSVLLFGLNIGTIRRSHLERQLALYAISNVTGVSTRGTPFLLRQRTVLIFRSLIRARRDSGAFILVSDTSTLTT